MHTLILYIEEHCIFLNPIFTYIFTRVSSFKITPAFINYVPSLDQEKQLTPTTFVGGHIKGHLRFLNNSQTHCSEFR